MSDAGSVLIWGGDTGLALGLGPANLGDADAPLPESVEAQTCRIIANLDAILAANGLSRAHVLGVTIHLTQFERFHARMRRALATCWEEDAALSVVGVTQLPRDALVQMDVTVTRQPRAARG